MNLVWTISILAMAWGGVLLTLVMLPGTWLTLLAAIGVQFLIDPVPMSWWTVAAVAVLALLGEIAETLSSAAGARRYGASKTGMTGAIVGAIAGAVGGTILIPIPIAGTLIGTIVGAAVLTAAAERGLAGRTWRQSGASATGAALGRLVAIGVKTAIAAAQAVIITVAIFVD